MAVVLVATDAEWIRDEVEAALGGLHDLHHVRSGAEVRGAIDAVDPDLVLLDLQIGNMGGIAACLTLRLEERVGRIPPQKVILLLDRAADEFLARRAEADGWLVKPLDSLRLRRAADAVLAGGRFEEIPSYLATP